METEASKVSAASERFIQLNSVTEDVDDVHKDRIGAVRTFRAHLMDPILQSHHTETLEMFHKHRPSS